MPDLPGLAHHEREAKEAMEVSKFYTCRQHIDHAGTLCLKPTVTDTLCEDHEVERAEALSRRERWPFWP